MTSRLRAIASAVAAGARASDRSRRAAAGLDGWIDRRPSGFCEVSGLNPDNDVPVAGDRIGRGRGIHVLRIAFLRFADHTGTDDVEENQHTSPRVGDDRAPKVTECSPAASPGIDNGGGSGGKRRVVRRQRSVVAENMRVDVDQAGNDVETRQIDYFACPLIRDVRGNCGNTFAGHRDVQVSIDVIRGIDYVASTKDYVVLLGRRGRYQKTTTDDQACACSHGCPHHKPNRVELSSLRVAQDRKSVV